MYVAYENIHAVTYFLRFDTETTGRTYNTTVAYRPDELSTSVCFHAEAAFQAINYTQLQFPPPNSFYTDCVMPGHGPDWSPASVDYSIGASPMFSYPPDVTRLVPSWSTCTLTNIIGGMDPPHTLGKATAMVPVSASSLQAAPAAQVTPAHAPATPTPSSKDPQGNDSPSDIDPSKDNPSQSDPGSNVTPSNTKLSGNGSSKDDPAADDPPSNTESPSSGLVNSDPKSLIAGAFPISPQLNTIPQDVQQQTRSSMDSNSATSIQSNGLGAQIASAFGYVPGSTAVPETDLPNNPVTSLDVPVPSPQTLETVTNGAPTPVLVGGSPVQKASNGAVVVAGQTVTQGDQATVSGVAVSVGTNNVAVDGTIHTFPPLAVEIPTPLIVGGNTAQIAPNGGLVVASQTITPGAQTTVAGVAVSVGNDNVILDGATHSLAPTPSSLLSIVINGITTTIAPGIAGATEAPIINIGGEDMTLSQTSPYTNTVGQTITPGRPGQEPPYIIAGQTLTPGGAAITVSGIPISLPANQPFASNAPAMAFEPSAIQTDEPTPVSVGDSVSWPLASIFIVGGTTVYPGGPGVTINGKVTSLLPPGAGLLEGSSRLALPAPVASQDSGTPVTVGGQVFTLNPSGFLVDGTSISAGGAGVTVAGTVVSLQPSGKGLVVGSSTFAVPSQAGTSLTSDGGSASPTMSASSAPSAAVTSIGTSGTVQSTSDTANGPSSTTENTKTMGRTSSEAYAHGRSGTLRIIASLVVVGALTSGTL